MEKVGPRTLWGGSEGWVGYTPYEQTTRFADYEREIQRGQVPRPGLPS